MLSFVYNRTDKPKHCDCGAPIRWLGEDMLEDHEIVQYPHTCQIHPQGISRAAQADWAARPENVAARREMWNAGLDEKARSGRYDG